MSSVSTTKSSMGSVRYGSALTNRRISCSLMAANNVRARRLMELTTTLRAIFVVYISTLKNRARKRVKVEMVEATAAEETTVPP